MKPITLRESDIARNVAQYLQLQYPDVLYRFDLAADMKLTMAQASRNKTLHPHRGYPDLWIVAPRKGFHGLYLELKREGTKILKKDGTLVADPHIREQWKCLRKLSDMDYAAYFAIGFDHARELIDSYLKTV